MQQRDYSGPQVQAQNESEGPISLKSICHALFRHTVLFYFIFEFISGLPSSWSIYFYRYTVGMDHR